MGKAITPARQARIDAEKSKAMPVRSWKDMSQEEREAVTQQINSHDRDVAKRRAEAAQRGKR